MEAIKKIQHTNGEKGANRYIISNNQSALECDADIRPFKVECFSKQLDPLISCPCFETVDDLVKSPEIMEKLYSNEGL